MAGIKTYGDLFTGGGGATLGALTAGLTPLWGNELDPAIAEVGNYNLGGHIRVGDVLEQNPRNYERVDFMHASPPCTRASVANGSAEVNEDGLKESPLDIALANKCIEFVETLLPEIFTLENVWGYRKFQSWQGGRKCEGIQSALYRLGYWVSVEHVNFADFGVPQTRKRMIVRAVRGGWVPHLPQPVPWIGWYEAISDILDTLPESQFAPWQLARLEPSLRLMIDTYQAERNEGYSDESISIKVLQILREKVGTEAILEWGARVTQRFQSEKVLRPRLHGESIRTDCTKCSDERGQCPLLFTEICKRWGVRDLRGTECERCASQKWRLDKQYTREFAAYLSKLSYENPQSSTDMFGGGVQQSARIEGLLQQTLSSFQEIWRSTVLENQNSRSQEVSDDYPGSNRRTGKDKEMGHFIRPDFPQSKSSTTEKSLALLVSNAKTEYSDGTRQGDDPAFTVTGESNGRVKAFLMGKNQDKFGDGIRYAVEPAQTIGANEHGSKAFIADQLNGGRDSTVRLSEEPVFTITNYSTKHPAPRAFDGGRVVAMTPRALARFQSFPDSYVLPDSKTLAAKIIGNAVCPLGYQRIVEGLCNL